MTSDNQNADPYMAVMADLRAQRDQIDKTLALLEGLRGIRSPQSAGHAPPASEDGGIVETAGMFLGMSIVDGAKKLLAMRKRTMGNVEIARELMAGGMALSSQEPANVIGSVLSRRFIALGDIVKVGRGIWGLKEWYPNRTFKPTGRNVAVVTGPASETSFVSDDDEPLNVQPTIPDDVEAILG